MFRLLLLVCASPFLFAAGCKGEPTWSKFDRELKESGQVMEVVKKYAGPDLKLDELEKLELSSPAFDGHGSGADCPTYKLQSNKGKVKYEFCFEGERLVKITRQ